MPDGDRYSDKFAALRESLVAYESVCISNKNPKKMLNWFIEVIRKNTVIYKNKGLREIQDPETFPRKKGGVFWIDFGMTIGSEFHDTHFAVVIKEQKYTALVVPLTTKKDIPPAWTEDTDLIVDIGVVGGFPEECKECLAFVGGMQSVSKKRLSKYRDEKRNYYDIELAPEQISMIQDNVFENICKKGVDISVAS